MIKSVAFDNFRGLDDIEVPLSNITLLTGTNGVGKTSVLEGLFCLFSETHVDVSHLGRYNRTIGTNASYNYKLFWDECPTHGASGCTVVAKATNESTLSWWHGRTSMLDISAVDEKALRDAKLLGYLIDSSSDIAAFNWKCANKDKEVLYMARVQVINPDGGLYLIPPENFILTTCRYIDFSTIRVTPKELPYRRAKLLVEALQIINPRITDVRIAKVESGLSVVLDNEREVSLGALGNGVVTWASALLTIMEIADKSHDEAQSEMPMFVLIDEIGAGVHYSLMIDLWKYISGFASLYPNIQFVSTTHSDDCVRAFCEAFQGNDTTNIVRLHKSAEKKSSPQSTPQHITRQLRQGNGRLEGDAGESLRMAYCC